MSSPWAAHVRHGVCAYVRARARVCVRARVYVRERAYVRARARVCVRARVYVRERAHRGRGGYPV